MKRGLIVGLVILALAGTVTVLPAEAKRIKQQPIEAGFQGPMNNEIKSMNGASKEMNQKTQKLVRELAVITQDMVRKDWKTIYIKAVPGNEENSVRFYYTDRNGTVYSGRNPRNLGLSGKKAAAASLRQAEVLEELRQHLMKIGQEMPSSVDITVSKEGRRVLTRFNYREYTSDVPNYLDRWEEDQFPNLK